MNKPNFAVVQDNNEETEILNGNIVGYESRTNYCPVRDLHLSEYQIPLSLIDRLPKSSQVRVQDCSETSVIEKAEQMKSAQFGQKTGVCVLPNHGRFGLLWGNTRYRAANVLDGRGEKIRNCKKGHIWASLYEHKESEIPVFQAKENNVHAHSEHATLDDNVNSILMMIRSGRLDSGEKKYADMAEEEQKTAVRGMYKRCSMPTHKFQSLWNRVRRRDKSTSKKMRTWDKTELAIYFGANAKSSLGYSTVTKTNCNKETTSGTVFVTDRKKIGVYFVTKSSEFGGATLANSNWLRNINMKCDEVVVVCSLNDVKGKDINKSRQSVIDKIANWNPSLKRGKSVDRIVFVPQTENEQNTEFIAGDFIKDTAFY